MVPALQAARCLRVRFLLRLLCDGGPMSDKAADTRRRMVPLRNAAIWPLGNTAPMRLDGPGQGVFAMVPWTRIAVAALLVAAATAASAQTYPTQPIRIIVP